MASEDVRAQLRDERLQALITEVDGARDREKVRRPFTFVALEQLSNVKMNNYSVYADSCLSAHGRFVHYDRL